MKKKPPVGLRPKKFHIESRYREVCEAITRYYEAGLCINEEWIKEYNELVVQIDFKEEEYKPPTQKIHIHAQGLKPSESAKLNREGYGWQDVSETKEHHRNRLLAAIESEFGPGCAAICKERARQKEVKGYDINRDAVLYKNEQLANAAVAYAVNEMHSIFQKHHLDRRGFWPWELKYWNPTPDNRQREFEKAGALLAAQIDVTTSQNK